MKKINTEQKTFLRLAAAIALSLIFLSTNVQKAECLSALDLHLENIEITACLSASGSNSSGCNIANDEAEFLMDQSEITRRNLASKTSISYDVLKKDQTICNDPSYTINCVPRMNVNYKKRTCDYNNFCHHDA